MTIDEKALEAACVAIATAAGMERDSVDEAVARAAITAYESAKQKAEGWRDIATACPTILKAARKLAADRVSGKVVIGCYGDVPAIEFRRLAALLSAGGEG